MWIMSCLTIPALWTASSTAGDAVAARELVCCWADIPSMSMCHWASRQLSVPSMSHLRYPCHYMWSILRDVFCPCQESASHSIELLEDANRAAMVELASHLNLQLVRCGPRHLLYSVCVCVCRWGGYSQTWNQRARMAKWPTREVL